MGGIKASGSHRQTVSIGNSKPLPRLQESKYAVLTKIFSGFSRTENTVLFKAIRRGLTLTLPVLLIGSFCVVFLNLPIPAYQDFIAQQAFISELLLAIHAVTLGVFSLYAAISISMSCAQAYSEKHGDFFMQGAPFAGTGAYLLLIGVGTEDFAISVLSTRSLFIAITAGLLGSLVYCMLTYHLNKSSKMYGSATDNFFNRALTSVLPVTVVVISAAVINAVFSFAFNVGSVEELFFQGVSAFFPSDTASLETGALYIFLNNIMWFFGLHGGNMLASVAEAVFEPGVAINAELLAAHMPATEIVTKTFLDVFVSIGGAGALLSLLLAILFFGRHRNMKKLSVLAAVPMSFNISEIMLFGFPVIWNPALLIPFILVPLVNLLVSYGATLIGFVPIVATEIHWTTPPLIGGYLATQSYAGVALQVVNIIIGMFIYLPFLRLYEKTLEQSELDEYQGLLSRFRESEMERGNLVLISLPGTIGLLVRALSGDLRKAINEGSFDLYYQPQFDVHDKGIGAEALLRWNHPVHGMMYPPLVVKLAEELDMIDQLERAVLVRALDDAQRVQHLVNEGFIRKDFAISVNATARALQNEAFVESAVRGVRNRNLDPGRLVIEATEHEALKVGESTTDLLGILTSAGIPLAIDDFSMGQTSFKYLETSAFSIVKLDGSIARGVMGNSRYAEIVSSITRLSEQLCFKVLAEYVETREQRDQLEELGCAFFQGYLYSPAIPFDDMIDLIQKYTVQTTD